MPLFQGHTIFVRTYFLVGRTTSTAHHAPIIPAGWSDKGLELTSLRPELAAGPSSGVPTFPWLGTLAVRKICCIPLRVTFYGKDRPGVHRYSR
jgi:hypothetical protein